MTQVLWFSDFQAKGGGKKGKKGAKGKPAVPAAPPKPPPDVLDPPAMDNLDLIAHNAPDALDYRNFGWPKGKKKKR